MDKKDKQGTYIKDITEDQPDSWKMGAVEETKPTPKDTDKNDKGDTDQE